MKFLDIIAYPEFKRSWQEIKREKGKYFFLFFQFLIFSDMLKIGRADWLLITNLCVSFILTTRYSNVKLEKIFLILIVYVIICIPPIVMFGISGKMFEQYIGYALRILTACFIANYLRNDFVHLFENLVFFLAYISIPLFLIQLINPHIYDIFTPLSRLVMASRQGYTNGKVGITMHQYFFIYVMNGWAVYRNSGFMWEPAAYGFMLTWALVLNLYMNKFSVNKKMLVFLLAIFTTFSLGTFSYLMLIVAMYLLQNFSIKRTFPIIFVLLGGYYLLTQTELFNEQYNMITKKTEHYSDVNTELEKIEKHGFENTNRVASIYANYNKLIETPFGFGMYIEEYVSSANGLINFLMKWGVFGALILIISFRKTVIYLKNRYYPNVNMIVSWLTVIVLIMPMIGNPIYNQVFFLAFLLMPYFFKSLSSEFIKQQRLYVKN